MEPSRVWMYQRLDADGYLSRIFIEKVDEFIQFATEQELFRSMNKIKCPCMKCWNGPYLDVDTVKLHLYKRGFRNNYYKWVCHGETFDGVSHPSSSINLQAEANPMRDMVLDAYAPTSVIELEMGNDEEEPTPEVEKFIKLVKAAEKPLYEGSDISLLKAVARLTNLKCEFNLPHRAVDGIASLMKAMCPNDNEMTANFYETKRLLSGLELPHHKIHVCPTGCMLFWKDDAELEKCKVCGAERWFMRKTVRGKKIPKKVLIYFPIGPRLQRLYATKNVAEHMTWHHENQRTDEFMEHPSDGEAWKHFDTTFQEFSSEPRNVRLGLSTDGFAPFSHYGQSYSCWPVIVTPYNLPPWMCMKRQFMFISLLIPGPKNPKGNFDIYMQPLIEELLQLWEEGILAYDIVRKQNFTMKVAVIWTISDFPAYGMLSGWMTAGRLSCPYCMEKTKSFRLKHGKKHSWFDCHRQFLCMDHPFRRNKTAFFKNREESSPPPPMLTGDEIWERVRSLPKASDHQGKVPGYGESHNWSRRSIFWDLPYWRKLLIRHNLDMMHIEKNVFEQVINTIMNVKGKSKDDINSRKDLAIHCKRQKLNIQVSSVAGGGQREVMPAAPYVLNKEQRKVLCEWISVLKFPDGYASNLSRCVDRTNWWLHNLKSHDCHVFMERLLPIATRELLPSNVWKVLTELSQFFRDMCLKKVHKNDVARLQTNVAEILCKVERIFSPSFFNVMEHLVVHLPYELKVGGPTQFRWMYSGERRMGNLKGKVGNKARVESSICNAYLMEEISDFCVNYFDESFSTKTGEWGRNVTRSDHTESNPNIPDLFSHNVGHAPSEGIIRYLDEREFAQSHAYVLSNCEILKPYERIFENEMVKLNPRVRIQDVWAKFEDRFPMWFKDYVISSKHIEDDILRSLAMGPRKDVRKWDHYYINNYNFQTYSYGKNKSTMNYGVSVKGVDGVEYYGILEEVIELTYLGNGCSYKTILFKCDWFDSINGLNVHEHYKLVDVNHTRKYPKYDPFVLAYQVTQVCFNPYPSMKNDRNHWWAVFNIKPRATVEAQLDETPFQEDYNDNPSTLADLDINEEAAMNDELVDDIELEEAEVERDEEGEVDEEDANDISVDEDLLEELLADEEE